MLYIYRLVPTFKRSIKTISNTMKYLNVAEKNDAAKNIANLLSRGTSKKREGLSIYNKIYEFDTTLQGKSVKMVMTSVSGHLLNYEFFQGYKNWKSCDPEDLFDAPIRKYCQTDYEKIRKTLEREIKYCQGLIIWTDCDREGENIGYEIIEVCKSVKSNITIYRAKFSEITSASVNRALQNLLQPDKRQSIAVDIRQQLDLRIGAAFTRLQTLRLQKTFPNELADRLISYGSCQIPTLGFVAQRYKEAEEFVSEPFWKIKVIHIVNDLTVEFLWARNRLFDKEACEDYFMVCLADPLASVKSVVVKRKSKWRPQPMDTVTLEKLGSKKLKINAKSTLQIAEKLYTQGYISYPRTETNSFSKDVNLRSLVALHESHPEWGNFAKRVLEWGPNPRNGNKSDEAHPPIHPTKFTTGLNGDEKRIYELIVRHFLACLSRDAEGLETVVEIQIATEKFTATGLRILERNYLDVYFYETWNAKQIHHYETDSTFEPTEIVMQEGATTAPPLLTEADLITLMEKHGIGTDATHAEHIHTIKERGYIGEMDNGFLVPGTIGMGLFEGYNAMELELTLPNLRANFEEDLKKICNGEKNAEEVLSEQIQHYKTAYHSITNKIKIFYEKMSGRLNENPQELESVDDVTLSIRTLEIFKCPKCSKCSMVLKRKKDGAGYYIGCLNFPECKNVIWLPDAIKDINVTDNVCTKCGPGYKKIEITFKQSNYLAMLDSTSNVYSTCIVCDSRFREVFNINIDNVKKVGNIIGSGVHKATNNDKSEIKHSSNKQQSGNLQLKNQTNTNSENTFSNWGEYFNNDNDDFENYLLNSELDVREPNLNNEILVQPGTSIKYQNSTENVNCDCRKKAELIIIKRNIPNQERSAYVCQMNKCSFFKWAEKSIPENITKKHGPQFSNTNLSRENSSNLMNAKNDDIVRCTNCQQIAKSLTVKKDGPNKGRPFFVCPTQQNDCQFFKWGDENMQENTSSSAWVIRNNVNREEQQNSSSGQREKMSSVNIEKKRKCGICRKEGHTKLKCPRMVESD